MQAADQLISASQPTPTPPTVAERTKLAAQQGIMGLASRLAPGLQQQGNRMAQQEMAGGLPQLSAPNMAGMASGGIVGYADGGAVDTDVQRYTEQYRAIMAAVQNASTPEQKAQLQQRLREIQSTFDPETVARAHMQMSGQGMADGGAVRGFAEGKKVEGAQPVGFTPTLPREGQPTSVEELIAEAERQERIRAQAERAREQRRPTDEAMAASLDSLATGNVDLSDTNAAEIDQYIKENPVEAASLALLGGPVVGTGAKLTYAALQKLLPLVGKGAGKGKNLLTSAFSSPTRAGTTLGVASLGDEAASLLSEEGY